MDYIALCHRLDSLLAYFASRGTGHAVPLNNLPAEFQTPELRTMLDMLAARGFVLPVTIQYDGAPTSFHQVLAVTPAGVWFAQSSSFAAEAKHQARERRRWDFEFFKIGFDTVIAILSLLISVSALVIAALKG